MAAKTHTTSPETTLHSDHGVERQAIDPPAVT
jgi:hypothetical protein